MKASFTVSVEKMPEVLAGMRAEFGRLVREIAADESPAVAKRLIEIAALFEAGQTERPDRDAPHAPTEGEWRDLGRPEGE